jgi:hypothetical protein
MYSGMRIEQGYIGEFTSVPARSRAATLPASAEVGDTVNLRSAEHLDRASSIVGSSYDPQPSDIANALIERGFDR